MYETKTIYKNVYQPRIKLLKNWRQPQIANFLLLVAVNDTSAFEVGQNIYSVCICNVHEYFYFRYKYCVVGSESTFSRLIWTMILCYSFNIYTVLFC
jgi:hypothetical protein